MNKYNSNNQDIGRKMPIFRTPLYLTCTITQKPFDFFSKILTQTVRVRRLLYGAKILIAKELSHLHI